MEPKYTYYAFISYSHKDQEWAEWIQHAVEHYKLPAIIRKEVQKPLPKKVQPVFLDKTDLGVDVLVDGLHAELEQSRYLIVVCSPNSARPNAQGKHFVDEEVRYFCELGRMKQIIPVIVEGSPEESFGPVLKEKGILALDATKTSRAKILNDIVAKILGLKPDVLWRRAGRERKKWLIIKSVTCGFLGLLIASAGYFVWDANRTVVNYYADYVDSFGIPCGIKRLNKDEISKRNFHYRFEYKGYYGFAGDRILQRVVHANSRGMAVPQLFPIVHERPIIQEFKYFRESVNKWGLSEIIHRDEVGDEVCRFRVPNPDKNKNNSVLERFGKCKRMLCPNNDARFGIDEYARMEGQDSCRKKIGLLEKPFFNRLEITRNTKGFPVLVEYFRQNPNGNIVGVFDGNGIHSVSNEYDETGRIISTSYFNVNHDKMPNYEVYNFSSTSNVLRIEHVTCKVIPEVVTNELNRAESERLATDELLIYAELHYDSFDNISWMVSWSGRRSAPIDIWDLTGWRFVSDTNGFRRVVCVPKPSSTKLELNPNGALSFNVCPDWLLEEVINDKRRISIDYDKLGRISSYMLIGRDGEPCHDDQCNWLSVRYEYDKGFIDGASSVIETFYSWDGIYVDDNGMAYARTDKDSNGQIITNAFYGSKRNFVKSPKGYAGWHREYTLWGMDPRSGVKEDVVSYFDENKDSVSVDGVARIRRSYSREGMLKSILYFDDNMMSTTNRWGIKGIRCNWVGDLLESCSYLIPENDTNTVWIGWRSEYSDYGVETNRIYLCNYRALTSGFCYSKDGFSYSKGARNVSFNGKLNNFRIDEWECYPIGELSIRTEAKTTYLHFNLDGITASCPSVDNYMGVTSSNIMGYMPDSNGNYVVVSFLDPSQYRFNSEGREIIALQTTDSHDDANVVYIYADDIKSLAKGCTNLVIGLDGTAGRRTEQIGRNTVLTYFDTERKPIENSAGVAREITYHDLNGERLCVAYENLKGEGHLKVLAVENILFDGQAARLGVRKNDVILSINSHPVLIKERWEKVMRDTRCERKNIVIARCENGRWDSYEINANEGMLGLELKLSNQEIPIAFVKRHVILN